MISLKNKKPVLIFFSGTLLIIVNIFLVQSAIKISLSRSFFSLGNYYFSQKAYNLSYAERMYRMAIQTNLKIGGAHYQLARIYFLQGQFDLARDMINWEIIKNPEFKQSFYVRGLINGYDGKMQEAANDFKEFLRWKPSSWAARNDLAWVYFQVGDFDKVLLLADDGLKYNPENPWLLNTKGLALYNLNRKKEAKEYLSKALKETEKLSPDDWKKAYPGNDPRFSAEGLNQMLKAIEVNKNLAI